ncbi:MAG TPA: hypothetical protein VFT87_03860 [Candidatus Saccharimonadales bacterium]|nr:hypothetical protein [Candidatus Saccharimonadales bacterium]
MLTVRAYLDLARNNPMTQRIKEIADKNPYNPSKSPHANCFEVGDLGVVHTGPKGQLYLFFQIQLGDPLPAMVTSEKVDICDYLVSLDVSHLNIKLAKFNGKEIGVKAQGKVFRTNNLESNAQVIQVIVPNLWSAIALLTHTLYGK